MNKTKVLITTIEPVSGGVPSMLRVIIDALHQRDYAITLAYYSPYSVNPNLSVPAFKLFQRKPSIKSDSFYGCDSVGVGCWLPEFEFTHHWLSKRWQTLIDQHELHMTVSGSCLASLPYVQTNTPFFAWIATDWLGDRQDRVQKFPFLRRLVDTLVIKPVLRRVERKVIASGNLVALSSYTQLQLNNACFDGAVENVLPMPIDTSSFTPQTKAEKSNRICFVGRFSDPRKNIRLLLQSAAQIVKRIPDLEVYLIGDTLSEELQQYSEKMQISQNITVIDYLSRDELTQVLPTCDVFVLPSYQEGLCIAAMEAMSCGVPVVSTRCGGPEMYIEDGVNGALVDFDVPQMSEAILNLLTNDHVRVEYAHQARKLIEEEFNHAVQTSTFWALFDQYRKSVVL